MICYLCLESIPMTHVQQGGLHIQCYEQEVTVFSVEGWTPAHVASESEVRLLISDMPVDSEIVVRKIKMKAGIFYNLPECDG